MTLDTSSDLDITQIKLPRPSVPRRKVTKSADIGIDPQDRKVQETQGLGRGRDFQV